MSAQETNLEPPAGWNTAGNAIERKFEFKDFLEAMAFVNNIARAAEEVNHHPDIFISYNKVTLQLTSHDSGHVTVRDVNLASRINSLLVAKAA